MARRTLYGGFQPLELLVLPDEGDALARLRTHLTDAQDVAAMRRMLAEDFQRRGLSQWSDQEVVAEVARLMAQGRLAGARYTADYHPVAMPSSTAEEAAGAPGDEAPTSAAQPAEAPPETTWVEIALVDEQGAPVAGEEYWVRTASGTAITGRLNAEGKARVRGVEPGTCEVTFPNLNATDWQPA